MKTLYSYLESVFFQQDEFVIRNFTQSSHCAGIKDLMVLNFLLYQWAGSGIKLIDSSSSKCGWPSCKLNLKILHVHSMRYKNIAWSITILRVWHFLPNTQRINWFLLVFYLFFYFSPNIFNKSGNKALWILISPEF